MNKLALSSYNASVIVSEKAIAEYFERFIDEVKNITPLPLVLIGIKCANLVMGDLFALLNKRGISIKNSPISPKSLAGLLKLELDGTISGRIAKDVFALMVETGKDAGTIVEEKGLRQVTDTGAIEAAIDKVIVDNAAKVADYRSGKQALFGWFVGQVMKATGGKANPAMVNELLRKKLAG